MRMRLAILAASCAAFVTAASPALAQKPGGTLRISHRDNPPSASIHEESTISVNQPFMAVFNNLVLFDPKEKVNSPDHIVPELAESWSYNADQTQLTFKLRQGVKWHDGKPFTRPTSSAPGTSLAGHAPEDKATHSQEPAQALVLQPQGGEDQRRLRGHLRPRPAAAVVPDHARRRLFAGLLLPRARPGDALQADRHRSVQGGRLQAQRVDQAGQEPGLLEEGQALSRRDRLEDRAQPQHAPARLPVGRVRHDVRFRRHLPASEGRQGEQAPTPSARRGRPTSAPTCWSIATRSRSTMRTSARRWCWRSTSRRSRDPEPGQRPRRRGDAAAAGGLLGHAEGACCRPCSATRPTGRRAWPRRAS